MKDMLRLGTKDRKKYLIISVVSVLVIALITVSIIAVQLRHNKNEKKEKYGRNNCTYNDGAGNYSARDYRRGNHRRRYNAGREC